MTMSLSLLQLTATFAEAFNGITLSADLQAEVARVINWLWDAYQAGAMSALEVASRAATFVPVVKALDALQDNYHWTGVQIADVVGNFISYFS
jgi:hypothetical protein